MVPLCNTLLVTNAHAANKQHNLRSLTISSDDNGNKTQAEVSNKRLQATYKLEFIPKHLNFSKGKVTSETDCEER